MYQELGGAVGTTLQMACAVPKDSPAVGDCLASRPRHSTRVAQCRLGRLQPVVAQQVTVRQDLTRQGAMRQESWLLHQVPGELQVLDRWW